MHKYLLLICICFWYIFSLPSPSEGIHKGARATEGGPGPFVEAAEGRLLHIWTREAEYIAKTYTNMY